MSRFDRLVVVFVLIFLLLLSGMTVLKVMQIDKRVHKIEQNAMNHLPYTHRLPNFRDKR